jgi:signal transduction histidine kinase
LSVPPPVVCRLVLETADALAELVHPDDRAGLSALASGAPSARPVELRVRDAAGDWRVLAVTTRKIPAVPGAVQQVSDVTTAAAARAALSALKSEFFAVMSHELRTPLTSIASMAELLGTEGLSDRDTGAAMAAVARNTERMLSVVEDLNALANLESGGLRGPGTAVDVAELVREAARSVDHVAVSVPDGPPVEGDPKLLAQLMHAVVGAVAAVATADPVTVSGSADEAAWTVTVRAAAADLGTAERLLAALPGPDGTPYRRSVGLSVLLARAIATSHGGTLTMAQEPDGEVSITVRLPVL